MEPVLRVLSLGGGVQSTALALMAAEGELPQVPDVAFFADTGWEPSHVYSTVEALRKEAPFPVITVGDRSLKEDTRAGCNSSGTKGFLMIPAFARGPSGKVSLGKRQCTAQYKIRPIERGIRAFMGVARITAKTPVEQWLGISTDEAIRAKDNRHPHITNRYPLLEAGLSRGDCAAYLKRARPSLKVGKSACVGCPYHSGAVWRDIARDYPEDFAEAVEIDRSIRKIGGRYYEGFEHYLHSSGRPLDEAVTVEASLFDGYGNECEGMCFL